MAKKSFLKEKKSVKRVINKAIKRADKLSKYCTVCWSLDNTTILDFFYHKESKVDRNRRVNDLANEITSAKLNDLGDQDFNFGAYVSPTIPKYFEYHVNGTDKGLVYAAATKGCGDVRGKHFRKILEDYDKIVGAYDYPYYPEQSSNYRLVRDTLIKLVNRFELLCISDSGYFWYTKYFREMTRKQGLSYLPTVEIK